VDVDFMSRLDDTKMSSVFDMKSGISWDLGTPLPGLRKMSSFSLESTKDPTLNIYKSNNTFPQTNVGTLVTFWFSLSSTGDNLTNICFTLVSVTNQETV
jgi:hypothetical protein